eukprot:TRINITY_DN26635_c0_g1_i3.p1 TRINITY_DN26635_c0_g1~~TRINITY_DN26635_c0_g1_i3.p1  ORF type:complete len:632 (-),score=131.06 TRINITY_DN26635_c0_g1_i3:364-2259(-)
MKGITHGACDYLLKPVRIEELKNIWQHVIRRRKTDHKDDNNSGLGDEGEKVRRGTGEGGLAPITAGPADPNGKLSKKRKDQDDDDDDDEDFDENGHGSEDPSAQKRPRVVWTVELHRKFVAAVNQLGIDKAVPKRILDLMNVERLTRENVASHLQKYRLYLKRISSVASQQANLAAVLGTKDLSYLHMGSLDGFGDFHSLSGSSQLPKAALSSFQGGGAFGRLNSPSGLGLHRLTSPGMIQLGRPQNTGNYISDLGNFQRATHSGNPHGNLLQGMPHSLELDHLQPNKPVSCLGGLSSPIDDSPLFPVGQQQLSGIGGFTDTGVAACSSSNSFLNIPNNPLLQRHPRQGLSGRLGSQSSLTMATLNTEPIDVSVASSSHLPDRRCNDSWQGGSPLAGYSANPLPMDAPFNSNDLSLANIPSMSSHMEINPLNASSSNMAVAAPLHESLLGRDLQCQTSSLGVSVRCMPGEINENLKFSNLGSMGNCIGQNMNYTQKQLVDHKQDCTHNQNIGFSSPLNSFLPNHGVMGIVGQSSGQNNCNRKVDTTLIGQSNPGTSFHMQQCDVGKLSADGAINFKEDYLSENMKLGGGFNHSSCSSFDDLMSSMIKRERDEMPLIDGGDMCDIFPLGTCM